MILSNKQITKALFWLRRLVCAFVVRKPLKTGFLRRVPVKSANKKIVFLFLNQNICCAQWDSSFEHSKHMLKWLVRKYLKLYTENFCSFVHLNLWLGLYPHKIAVYACLKSDFTGDWIFQYCTCPAGRVTFNFHSSCKHMHLSFKSVCYSLE